MKKNKRFLTGFLLLPLVLMSSCGRKDDTISIFLYNSKDEFINDLNIKLTYAFKKDFNVVSYNADNKQINQNYQIVDSYNKYENKLLIVNTVDRLSAKTILELASKKDTPVIFINRQPIVSDIKDKENVYYVGTDPIYEGIAQAEIADELFGGKTNFINSNFDKNKDGKLQIVLLKGEQGHQDAEYRTTQSLKKLADLGYDIELLCTDFYDWSEEKAMIEFNKTYNNYLNEDGSSKIELLLSNNDTMGIGCSKFLATLDNYDSQKTIAEQYFPIIGVDGTDYGINAVKHGLIYGTVKNDSITQADAISILGRKLINKESLDDFNYEFTDGNFLRTKGEKFTYKNIK